MSDRGSRPRRGLLRRIAVRGLVTVVVLAAAVTAASFGYNLATDGQVSRPVGLTMVNAGATVRP
jgi:hypothetical protein